MGKGKGRPQAKDLYLYHGTNEAGFSGIGDGNRNAGGLVGGGRKGWWNGGWFNLSQDGMSGLGRGIYGTTYYTKAREFGEYVYLLQFKADAIKVVDEWDTQASWRNDGVSGVYMPTTMLGGAAQRDEFCMRGRTLVRVWLVRYPDGCTVENWYFQEPHKLRCCMENIIHRKGGRLPFKWHF